MSNPLKKLARYGCNGLWTNRYFFEKSTTQMIPFTLSMMDEPGGELMGFKEMIPKLVRHTNTTSLCSQMVFGGEAMAPAITSQPRFGAGADGESSGGDVKSGGKPTYNLLLVRQLMYPEFVSPKR
jgi:hypothetical protein